MRITPSRPDNGSSRGMPDQSARWRGRTGGLTDRHPSAGLDRCACPLPPEQIAVATR